jgi:hypothetical protein
MMLFFVFLRHVELQIDANASEKHIVSTFRAEVETVCFSETLVFAYESTRRQNAERHYDRRGNLESRNFHLNLQVLHVRQ